MHFSSHSHIPFYQNYTDMLWKTMLLLLVFKPRSSHYQQPVPTPWPPGTNSYLWHLALVQHVFIICYLSIYSVPHLIFYMSSYIRNWNIESLNDLSNKYKQHLELTHNSKSELRLFTENISSWNAYSRSWCLLLSKESSCYSAIATASVFYSHKVT